MTHMFFCLVRTAHLTANKCRTPRAICVLRAAPRNYVTCPNCAIRAKGAANPRAPGCVTGRGVGPAIGWRVGAPWGCGGVGSCPGSSAPACRALGCVRPVAGVPSGLARPRARSMGRAAGRCGTSVGGGFHGKPGAPPSLGSVLAAGLGGWVAVLRVQGALCLDGGRGLLRAIAGDFAGSAPLLRCRGLAARSRWHPRACVGGAAGLKSNRARCCWPQELPSPLLGPRLGSRGRARGPARTAWALERWAFAVRKRTCRRAVVFHVIAFGVPCRRVPPTQSVTSSWVWSRGLRRWHSALATGGLLAYQGACSRQQAAWWRPWGASLLPGAGPACAREIACGSCQRRLALRWGA